MEPLNLNRLVYFSAVVEAGSFTGAAKRLGITKAVVSQQVTRLEEELEVTLLTRTTRRVEPTESGRLLHARSIQILREAEDALGEITQSNAEPRGTLRVAVPNDYGTATIAPLAAVFSRRYPDCRVDLLFSDTRIDPVSNQIDLSIRVGWLESSSLQARRIGGFRQLLVATPKLAAAYPLSAPEDLSSAPFIANSALKTPLVWRFTKDASDERVVRMRQTLSMNTTPAVLSAALAGGGLAILPDFLVSERIAGGDLVPILAEWTLPEGGIHVVYPPARFRPGKVTTFVSMLVEHARRAGA